mmetsp:Transcript_17359/g.20035  ORF Transcript_17359/g.20035 Transcript_17359/m.20035 type:complete len:333 (+) Transcript_17359:143-1141(+)
MVSSPPISPSSPYQIQLEARSDLEDTATRYGVISPNATSIGGLSQQSRRRQQQHLNSGSDVSSISSTSWSNRILWMIAAHRFNHRQPKQHQIEKTLEVTDEYTLHRDRNGLMGSQSDLESYGSPLSTNPATPAALRHHCTMSRYENSSAFHHINGRRETSFRLSPSSDTLMTADVDDWDNREWTPKDSAYGAACPICGFLTKNVRRGIEFSLIALACFGLILLIVHVSISITNDHRGDSNDVSQQNLDDYIHDDHYIAYSDNDDYFDHDGNDGRDGGKDRRIRRRIRYEATFPMQIDMNDSYDNDYFQPDSEDKEAQLLHLKELPSFLKYLR